jgi:omega-6 fatty acid desaturase (delta-12 desaturase)
LGRESLAAYARPRLGRGMLDLATSVVPFLVASVGIYLLIDVSVLLALALAIPTAGFLVRTFIVFHDCGHGSFLPSRRANRWVGRTLGVLLMTRIASWRHDLAVHHATAGDLERRGVGDLPTMTVAEYVSASAAQRLSYRLFRNPIVMFGVGPLYAMIIAPRIPPRYTRSRLRRSVLGTDLAIAALVAGLCVLIGWEAFLIVWLPAALLAGSAGIWLFYVQHQFEDAYWEDSDGWSYADAALRGSSYLRLPRILQFFTGNIGLHHVHHLNARIPNYNLQRAHDENPVFESVPTLSFADGMRAVRLKLFDQDSRRMITWRELRQDRARTWRRDAGQVAPAARR